MATEEKEDLRWLSDLSGGLVKELEAEDTKMKEMQSRMRAAAIQIEAEAKAELARKEK